LVLVPHSGSHLSEEQVHLVASPAERANHRNQRSRASGVLTDD
jgi:hypothetical protein